MEDLKEFIADQLLEGAGVPGAGIVFKFTGKVVGSRILERIKQRVSITVPERGHLLYHARDRCIGFVVYAQNPTPLTITIWGGTIDITNKDIVIDTCHFGIYTLGKEFNSNIAIATYRPISNPLGLPAENEQWALKGQLHLHCYYGKWDMPIETLRPFSIHDDKRWEEARNWLAEQRKEISG